MNLLRKSCSESVRKLTTGYVFAMVNEEEKVFKLEKLIFLV